MIGPSVTASIKKATEISDGMGGFTQTWETIKEIKGVIISIRAREKFTNDSERSFSTHFFQCKYFDTPVVEESCLLYIGNDKYEIIFVDNLSYRNILYHFELLKIK